jgi:hypothetical protein
MVADGCKHWKDDLGVCRVHANRREDQRRKIKGKKLGFESKETKVTFKVKQSVSNKKGKHKESYFSEVRCPNSKNIRINFDAIKRRPTISEQ